MYIVPVRVRASGSGINQPLLVQSFCVYGEQLTWATHLVAGKTCDVISTKRSKVALWREVRLNRTGDNLMNRVDQQATRQMIYSSAARLDGR